MRTGPTVFVDSSNSVQKARATAPTEITGIGVLGSNGQTARRPSSGSRTTAEICSDRVGVSLLPAQQHHRQAQRPAVDETAPRIVVDQQLGDAFLHA